MIPEFQSLLSDLIKAETWELLLHKNYIRSEGQTRKTKAPQSVLKQTGSPVCGDAASQSAPVQQKVFTPFGKNSSLL